MNKFLLKLLFFFPFLTQAQTYTITGYIYNQESKETLVGANVIEAKKQLGTATNAYGYYALNLKADSVTLNFSYIGYETQQVHFLLKKDTFINIELQDYRNLATVEVKATSLNSTNTFLGTTYIKVKELKKIPTLLGETDLVRALSLTPGISTGAEGTTGLFVRGGTPDQNLILLDGATVYNAAHIFGFLSVFNSDAIKDVKLYKAAFPAEYGGRLSSILNITMIEGNKKEAKKSLSLGLLSSRFLWESPLKKEKSSFMLAARTSYLSLLTLPLRLSFNKNKNDFYNGYWLYDLNGKVNVQLTDKDQLFMSFYGGQDFFEGLFRNDGEVSSSRLEWGNQTATLRYTKIFSSHLFGNFLVAYNRYAYLRSEELGRNNVLDKIDFINTSSIQDFTAKGKLTWNVASQHSLNGGFEITKHHFQPGTTITQSNTDTLQNWHLESNPLELAFYIEDKITLGEKWKAAIGLRYMNYQVDRKHFHFVEPRLSLQFHVTPFMAFSTSYSEMNQAIHLLSNNGVGLPNDIWYPATKDLKPQKSKQVSFAWKYNMKSLKSNISIELWHKTLNNQVDYREGVDFLQAENNLADLLEGNGRGEAYGAEFFLHKNVGRFNGWLAYTLSWNRRQFENINFGNWYFHRYDRRHDVALTGSFQLNDKWQISSSFIYTSGHPVTLPSASYIGLNGGILGAYTSRNNARLPHYHRMDIAVTRKTMTKRKRQAEWNFSIYNVYARKNPYYLRVLNISSNLISQQDIENGIIQKRYIYQRSLFSILPSINYRIEI